jgi:hypothetical protein
MPKSGTSMTTSGRPVVSSQAVWIGPCAHVPAGWSTMASTRLMPRIPHNSSRWLFTVAVIGLESGLSGVAASFQSAASLKSFGTTPGASRNVSGLCGLPPGAYGKSACADPVVDPTASAISASILAIAGALPAALLLLTANIRRGPYTEATLPAPANSSRAALSVGAV